MAKRQNVWLSDELFGWVEGVRVERRWPSVSYAVRELLEELRSGVVRVPAVSTEELRAAVVAERARVEHPSVQKPVAREVRSFLKGVK